MHRDTGWQTKVDGGCDQTEFSVDWDNMTATCPEGQTSIYLYGRAPAAAAGAVVLQAGRSPAPGLRDGPATAPVSRGCGCAPGSEWRYTPVATGLGELIGIKRRLGDQGPGKETE
jgi:hypothetical protein